jgi:hypothetical protein
MLNYSFQTPIPDCSNVSITNSEEKRGYHADIHALVDDFRLPNIGPCLMMGE